MLHIPESVLEALEARYSMKLTREVSHFPLLLNYYSKQIDSPEEEVVVVEIKPKPGVVEPLFPTESAQIRAGPLFNVPYCMLKEKKEIKLGRKLASSNYDPRLLYSGDEEVMLEGITTLTSVPNRYWKVRTVNSSLDLEKSEHRVYLWKLVAKFLKMSGVLTKLLAIQKHAVTHSI